MKTKLLSLLAIVAVLFSGSCSYDDSDLQNRVEQLEQDVAQLQQLVSQMNTNLQALQTTVDVITSGDYIKTVTPVKAGEDVIGYTFTFGKNDPITIYNGEDGNTPAISVKLGGDGKYYWTLNGEIMKDSQGNDVPATGVAPQLRINDGIWQYSIDNGNNWKNVDVTGYAGIIFKTVAVGENKVDIELADGTKFEIPLMSEFKLTFDQTYFYLEESGVLTVNYTIKGADDMTSVVAFPSGDVTVVVTKESASKGTLTVTKGATASDVQVLVMATNGKGQKDYEILNFANLEMTVTSADVALGAGEGSTEIEIASNVEYEITLSENVSWLTYSLEAAAVKSDNASKVLTITTQANPLRRIRTVDVQLMDKFGNIIKVITVAQAAADYPAGGQLGDIPVLPA